MVLKGNMQQSLFAAIDHLRALRVRWIDAYEDAAHARFGS